MLKDISLRFDPIEDRLVMRLTLQAADGLSEHWLQLTRRLCAAWRHDLQAMVDLSAGLPERMDRSAKAVVSSANHQAQSSRVPTRVEPARQTQQPAPVDVPLVTRIECGRRRSDGRWVLRFELRERPPLALVISDPTLHALVDALSRRVQAAGWNLPPIAVERARDEPKPSAPLH